MCLFNIRGCRKSCENKEGDARTFLIILLPSRHDNRGGCNVSGGRVVRIEKIARDSEK